MTWLFVIALVTQIAINTALLFLIRSHRRRIEKLESNRSGMGFNRFRSRYPVPSAPPEDPKGGSSA